MMIDIQIKPINYPIINEMSNKRYYCILLHKCYNVLKNEFQESRNRPPFVLIRGSQWACVQAINDKKQCINE